MELNHFPNNNIIKCTKNWVLNESKVGCNNPIHTNPSIPYLARHHLLLPKNPNNKHSFHQRHTKQGIITLLAPTTALLLIPCVV